MKTKNQRASFIKQTITRLILSLCLMQFHFYEVRVFAQEVQGRNQAQGQTIQITQGIGTILNSDEQRTEADKTLNGERTIQDNVLRNEELLRQNINHEAVAEAAGGIVTKCRTVANYRSELFDNQIGFRETVLGQNLSGITEQRLQVEGTTADLVEASQLSDPTAGSSILPQGSDFRETEQQLRVAVEEASERASRAQDRVEEAEAELRAAESICPDTSTSNPFDGGFSCSFPSRQRVINARLAASTARQEQTAANNALAQANRAFQLRGNSQIPSRPQLGSAQARAEQEERDLIPSHRISGCSNIIGRSLSTECTLTGPLFEQNQELTRLANASIEEARFLAQSRSERLLNLELQSQFNGDYELYEAALAEIDGSQLNGQVAQSNLDVMGIATAAVKNLECTPHPLSEVDSNSYHLFKAASATYLIAQVNETSYYAQTADSCRAQEEFTEESRDLQVRTVERAANLTNQQIENLCLRVRPTDPELSAECDRYIEEILGAENVNRPRTREQALEMYQQALEFAIEELNTKRQKVATADAEVRRGEALIESASNRQAVFSTLNIIYIAIGTAFLAAFASSCPICNFGFLAAAIAAFALAAINLISAQNAAAELERAQSYTEQQREILRRAYYYSHLVCNYGDAKSQEGTFAEIATSAREDLEVDIKRRENEVLRRVDSTFLNDNFLTENGTANPNIPTIQEASDAIIEQTQRPIADQIELPNIDSSIIPEEIPKEIPDLLPNGDQSEIPDLEELQNVLPSSLSPQSSIKAKELDKTQSFTFDTGFLAKFLNNLGAQYLIPNAHAQLNGQALQSVNREAVRRTANSLGIAAGSSSFEYFLIRRNFEWQRQANDVSNNDNFKGEPLVNLEQLIIDVSILDPSDNTGFPIPETRVNTIQNVISAITTNLGLTNSALDTLNNQRNEYVQLLRDFRNRFKLGDQGLDNVNTQTLRGPTAGCLATASNGSITIDPNCNCSQTNTCSQFEYPDFGQFAPGAISNTVLRFDGQDNLDSQLGSANLGEGVLGNNATRAIERIEQAQERLNQARKNAGLPPRSIAADANANESASTAELNRRLGNLSISGQLQEGQKVASLIGSNSALGGGLTRSQAAVQDKETQKESVANNIKSLNTKVLGPIANKGNTTNAAGQAQSDDETFNLDGSGNASGEALDWDKLAQEQREKREEEKQNSSIGRGTSSLSSSRNQGRENSQSNFSGINENRGSNIFKIISKRYKKSAFPLLIETPLR